MRFNNSRSIANNCTSNFSKHISENEHPINTTDNNIEILYIQDKVNISTQQKNITSMKKQNTINDQNTFEPNAIFRAFFPRRPIHNNHNLLVVSNTQVSI